MRCAIDVAQGLEFMHSRAIPILHRDLKSANVLVQDLEPTSAVVAALCDFGLATRFTGTESRGPNDNPRWTAPEVLQYQPYTTKADIYSYGVVLFEIMTGRVPFDDDSFEFIVSKRVIKGDRPRLPDSIEPAPGAAAGMERHPARAALDPRLDDEHHHRATGNALAELLSSCWHGRHRVDRSTACQRLGHTVCCRTSCWLQACSCHHHHYDDCHQQ